MATREKIAALINVLDQLEQLLGNVDERALPEHEARKLFDDLWEVRETAARRLMFYLAYTDNMLVGAEHCNECGEVSSVVTKIDREPELMIVTSKDAFYPQDVCGTYFRLPGSEAYGEQALVELARQRVAPTA